MDLGGYYALLVYSEWLLNIASMFWVVTRRC